MSKHRITVEVLVTDASGRMLLVRQEKKRTGDWELPGGKVKKGESIAAAARREVLEETGIEIGEPGIVGVFFVADERTHDVVLRYTLPTSRPPVLPNPPEVSKAEWFTIDQLPSPVRPFTESCVRNFYQAVAVPATEIDSEAWVGKH